MLKRLLLVVAISCCSYNYAQTIHNVENPKEIDGMLLEAGDTVILKDGTYTEDETLDIYAEGTATQPVTIRPQTPGGVIFTGSVRINLAGSYVVIDGFHWKEGEGASNFIQLRAKNNEGVESYAQNCTIQNCVIDGLRIPTDDAADDAAEGSITKHRWIVLYGNYNNVLNCTFMNKVSAGALVLVEMAYNDPCEPVGHTISNNYFYNFEKINSELTNAGDSETIRVGTSEYQNYNSATTVSNNYFVQADGENEIITNKSANNIYTNNTFRRCRGSLVLRHGPGATVNKNYFLGENVDGTGGLRIVDSDHTITNNYIQDCITVLDQAKWNNGLTFMGGAAASVTDCNSTSVSNGYQKSENNYVANNTIINTNAPLFYNGDKGTSSNTGTVENNLIYFQSGNANTSDIMNEDDEGDYSAFGESLTYSGNIFDGTTIGIANTGFAEETIDLTESGEVFTHNKQGKGADMGGFEPHTDAMVGNGVGACFLDSNGATIANPNCTIVEIDKLNVGALDEFVADGESQVVNVNTNVAWTASESLDWVTISATSGTGEGDESITVVVAKNTESISRSGVISFTQNGGDLSATLNVSQEAPDVRANFTLINDGGATDNVDVESVFHEEVTDSKNNVAINSLDKDFGTQWSGMNGTNGISPGEIVYDLGGAFNLALVDFASTSGKTYEFQVWVSTTGTEEVDFANAFPDSGNLISNTSGEFESFVLPTIIEGVKYVKILGYGQPSRPSDWNTITEIEFYKQGEGSLSTNEVVFSETLVYPVPADNDITLKNFTDLSTVEVLSVDGKLLTTQNVEAFDSTISVDTSSLTNGIYLLKLTNSSGISAIKKVVIQHKN